MGIWYCQCHVTCWRQQKTKNEQEDRVVSYALRNCVKWEPNNSFVWTGKSLGLLRVVEYSKLSFRLPFPFSVIVSDHFWLLWSSYNGHFRCSFSFAGCSHFSATVSWQPACGLCRIQWLTCQHVDFLHLLHNTLILQNSIDYYTRVPGKVIERVVE